MVDLDAARSLRNRPSADADPAALERLGNGQGPHRVDGREHLRRGGGSPPAARWPACLASSATAPAAPSTRWSATDRPLRPARLGSRPARRPGQLLPPSRGAAVRPPRSVQSAARPCSRWRHGAGRGAHPEPETRAPSRRCAGALGVGLGTAPSTGTGWRNAPAWGFRPTRPAPADLHRAARCPAGRVWRQPGRGRTGAGAAAVWDTLTGAPIVAPRLPLRRRVNPVEALISGRDETGAADGCASATVIMRGWPAEPWLPGLDRHLEPAAVRHTSARPQQVIMGGPAVS